jgi:D-psicose/D-tagatose/L-ribulose 3-epimerase
MKYGVTTYIWTAEFLPEHLPLLAGIREGGFDGIELPIFRPDAFPAAEIRKGVEAAGMECTASAVLVDGLNLISDDAGIRQKTVARLRDTVKAAAEAGSKMIAGPVYAPVGYLPGRRRTADEWKWAVEGFQALGDTLTAHDVTLAIEPLNRFETYFLNTAADAGALAEQVNHPKIGILFDTFHANIEEKDIAAACRSLGRHLKHVHTCENDRGAPGSGHVEWPCVFQALRDLNYDGWMVIEGFSFALGDISAAASIWRDIETTPEVIAYDGVRFLKGSWEANS